MRGFLPQSSSEWCVPKATRGDISIRGEPHIAIADGRPKGEAPLAEKVVEHCPQGFVATFFYVKKTP